MKNSSKKNIFFIIVSDNILVNFYVIRQEITVINHVKMIFNNVNVLSDSNEKEG